MKYKTSYNSNYNVEDSSDNELPNGASDVQKTNFYSDYSTPGPAKHEDSAASGTKINSPFAVLANCAEKELRILAKKQSDRKENRESYIQKEYLGSDSDDEFEVDFPTTTVHGQKMFKCVFQGCLKVFPSLSRMRRHYIIHTGAKPFKCINAGCPKTFSRRDNMIQHYKGHCTYTKK